MELTDLEKTDVIYDIMYSTTHARIDSLVSLNVEETLRVVAVVHVQSIISNNPTAPSQSETNKREPYIIRTMLSSSIWQYLV